MIRKKRGRELFELLGDKKKEPQGLGKPHVSQEHASVEQAAGTAPVITVKQETGIFVAIILLLLVIFSFILGYYRGKNDAGTYHYNTLRSGNKTSEQQVGSAAQPGSTALSPSLSIPVPPLKETVLAPVSGGTEATKPAPSSQKKYALRVWTGGHSAVGKAREVVAFFRSKGFISWSKKDSEGIKIFIGRFASKSEVDAVRTRNQVRELMYRGSRPFQDCYLVRLEN